MVEQLSGLAAAEELHGQAVEVLRCRVAEVVGHYRSLQQRLGAQQNLEGTFTEMAASKLILLLNHM